MKFSMIKSLIFVFLLTACVFGQEGWLNLWPGLAPGAERPAVGSEKVKNGWVSGVVEVPQYFLMKPAKPNGLCVVVLPGGGYGGLAIDHEGAQVGKWLVDRGITALVVKYRVSDDATRPYHFPVPQMDARRAIRTARVNAAAWKINPQKIGVIGFSAGGHLASCAATQFKDIYEVETKDVVDAQSCRPDFAILCYPVIAMGESYCHQGSVKNLLGENPSPILVTGNNTAKQVSSETPPVFIVHAADDKVVPLRNATDFAASCAENDVPLRVEVFASGGHGFGMAGKGTSAGWDVTLAEWLTFFVKS